MAIAFVESQAKDSGATPATTSAFAATIATGQLLVAYGGMDGGSTGLMTGVTDSKGNTWHQITGMDIANGGGTLNLDAWYCVPTTGGASFTVSVAFNDVSTNCNAVVQYFNGFTGTPTLDKVQHSSNTSSTTATSGATAATTQATEIVIGGAVHASTVSAYTLGAGYTNLKDSSVAARQTAMESKVVGSTGAQTATFTIAAARVNIGGVATFYDAPAGSVLTKTQTAVARIANNITKTQSAVARIQRILTKTQSAVARIANIKTKTQSAVSRISNTKTSTQPAVARIQKSVTKTQPATATIKTLVTKTQSAVARIANIFTKTQTAISRISNTFTKTQPATARIQRSVTKIQAATAKIQVLLTKTQSAVAKVIQTFIGTKTQPAQAAIAVNLSKAQSAVATIIQTAHVTPGVGIILNDYSLLEADGAGTTEEIGGGVDVASPGGGDTIVDVSGQTNTAILDNPSNQI